MEFVEQEEDKEATGGPGEEVGAGPGGAGDGAPGIRGKIPDVAKPCRMATTEVSLFE